MTSAANPPAAPTSAKPKTPARPRAKAAATPAAAVVETVAAAPVTEPVAAPDSVAVPTPEVALSESVLSEVARAEDVPPQVVVAPVVVAPVVVEPVGADAPVVSVVNAVSASAQDNLDALVRSGEVLSQGLQDLGRAVLTLAQDSIDDGVALSRRLFEIKSLQEFLEVQSSLVQTQLDRLVSEGTRLGDLSVKLAEAAAQPLNERFHAVVDRIFHRAA